MTREFNILIEEDEDGVLVASVPDCMVATRRQKHSMN